jgi:hypothetical protein
MVNESPAVTEQQLPEWLLQHVPALIDAYTREMAMRLQDVIDGYEGDPNPNAYFVLSFVLKPHLNTLLAMGQGNELQRIFGLLEYLAQHGDASIQNELGVTMEEMDVWRIWPFLGPMLRSGEVERVTWLPEDVANAHVDRTHYRRRWQEEIEHIGGWEHLTDGHQMWIRYRLVEELKIVGLRAPEPGGVEWLASGLPWPLPSDAD